MAELTESERESVATLLAEQRHGIEWRWVAERTRQKYRDMADAMFTSPAVEQILAAREAAASRAAVLGAAAAIVKNGPVLNFELRHDGTEDPLAAAYVEGHRDAHDTVRAYADEHYRAELLRQGGGE